MFRLSWLAALLTLVASLLTAYKPKPPTSPPPPPPPVTTTVAPTTTTVAPTMTTPPATTTTVSTVAATELTQWGHEYNTGPRVTPGAPGPCGTIQTNGAVLQSRTCTDFVHVWGDDVRISDSKFLAGLIIEDPAERTLVEWSEVQQGISIASVKTATVKNTDIKFGSDLVHITSDRGFKSSDITLDTIWAHEPTAQLPSHVDGVQVRGVDRLNIVLSTFDLGPWVESENAAIFLETANGGNNDVSISYSYLNGGGYPLYVGTGGHPGLKLAHNKWGVHAKWGAECLLVNVTPVQAIDNRRIWPESQARGCPIIP